MNSAAPPSLPSTSVSHDAALGARNSVLLEAFWYAYSWTVVTTEAMLQAMVLVLCLTNGTAEKNIASEGLMLFLVRWAVQAIFYFTAGVIIILPFCAFTVLLTRRFRLHGFGFYALMSLIASAMATSAIMVFDLPLFWVDAETTRFLDRLHYAIPMSTLTGFTGGITMWILIGRHKEYFGR